jgi:AraC family transcriptional regulator of adaptative response/methylated-DNA-[protein]-cysteine methyltransferase
MTPTDFRSGGPGESIRFAVGECSLGSILFASTEKGVCAILIGDDPDRLMRDLQDRFSKARLIGGDKGFQRLVTQVIGFVEAPASRLLLPGALAGAVIDEGLHGWGGMCAGRTIAAPRRLLGPHWAKVQWGSRRRWC